MNAYKYMFCLIILPFLFWGCENYDDDQGVPLGGSGARLTPRDMARFGYLYLKMGNWDGKQIVPEEWVERSQQKHMARA